MKDFYKNQFDEGTITKLEIFERYTAEWLPVFIMGHQKNINIFDFFAGAGCDSNKTEGSPIRILKQIKKYVGKIFQNNKIINVYFNENNNKINDQLVDFCNQFIESDYELARLKTNKHLNIEFLNDDFEILFEKKYLRLNSILHLYS